FRSGVGIRYGFSFRTRAGIQTVDDRVDIRESASSVWDASGLYWDNFVLIGAESVEHYSYHWRSLWEAETIFSPKSTTCIGVGDTVLYQPWCIQYLQLELAQSYELKSRLIHLLPKFHGLVGEDPHKHLKEFHVGSRRLYQDEGLSILSRWSSEGLAISIANHVQHMGRHEAHVLGEILPNIQDCDHLKGDLWDLATFPRDNA
ncbi:hypothetical protein CR513_56868, partial [Mucuna pruriens]